MFANLENCKKLWLWFRDIINNAEKRNSDLTVSEFILSNLLLNIVNARIKYLGTKRLLRKSDIEFLSHN